MISERIRSIRRFFKLTQHEIAEKLSIQQSAYSRYENRGTVPSIDILSKISNLFNVDLNWLITGEGDMLKEQEQDMVLIPRADGEMTKGVTFENVKYPELLEQIPVSNKTFEEFDIQSLQAMQIFGDAMETEGECYKARDLVFFTTHFDIQDDGIYIIRRNKKVILRRIKFAPGKMLIISDNNRYPEEEIPWKNNDPANSPIEFLGVPVGKLRIYR